MSSSPRKITTTVSRASTKRSMMSRLIVIFITLHTAIGVHPRMIFDTVGSRASEERNVATGNVPTTPSQTATNPNIIINVNNFIYIPGGATEVTVRPTKEQVVNIAQGNGISTCGYTRHERESQWEAPAVDLETGENGARMMLGRRKPHTSGNHDWMDNPETRQLHVWQQLKRVQPSDWNDRSSESPAANDQSLGSKLENTNPKLNIFIDGKIVEPDGKTQSPNKEDVLSQYFKDEMKEILKASREDIKERSSNCFSKDGPPCHKDLVTIRGGLELSYEEFTNIFEEIEERPERIKCIVPGGVTGPLAGYFEKVNKTKHDQAIEHGVCVFDNGYLVPVKAMCRILSLHKWLWDLTADRSHSSRNSEDIRKLHSTLYWMSAVNCSQLELISCLIKSDKVQVILSGRKATPFAQFEQQEHLIPVGLLNKALVMLLRYRIPYVTFRDSLYDLCISKNSNE